MSVVPIIIPNVDWQQLFHNLPELMIRQFDKSIQRKDAVGFAQTLALRNHVDDSLRQVNFGFLIELQDWSELLALDGNHICKVTDQKRIWTNSLDNFYRFVTRRFDSAETQQILNLIHRILSKFGFAYLWGDTFKPSANINGTYFLERQ